MQNVGDINFSYQHTIYIKWFQADSSTNSFFIYWQETWGALDNCIRCENLQRYLADIQKRSYRTDHLIAISISFMRARQFEKAKI